MVVKDYKWKETHKEPVRLNVTEYGPFGNIEALLGFINSHGRLVEPSVLADANKMDDKAISLALGQIHHKSLSSLESKKSPNVVKSFKEVLLSSSAPKNMEKSRKDYMGKKDHLQGNTVFITGFSNDLLAKDIWAYFQKGGKVKDIILPRKKDIYNNRIGFIVATNSNEATLIIKAFNGKKLFNNKLYLSMARNKKMGSVPLSQSVKANPSRNSGNPTSSKKHNSQGASKVDMSRSEIGMGWLILDQSNPKRVIQKKKGTSLPLKSMILS